MRFYAAHQRIGKNVANAGTGSVSDFVVETAGGRSYIFLILTEPREQSKQRNWRGRGDAKKASKAY